MMYDQKRLRRAQAEDIQKILFAAPSRPWTSPESPREGVVFEIHSSLGVDSLCRAFPAQFRDISDMMPQQLDRRIRIHSAGGFKRTDEIPGDKIADVSAFALESPELGAVYVDVRDKSYIQFSSSQLPQVGLPTSLKKVALKWEVTKGKENLTLSVQGVVSLDVVIEYSTQDKVSSELAAVILSTCLPGLNGLVELGLPLKQIAAGGTLKTVETWLVNDKGLRVQRLALHRVSRIKTGPVDDALFRIPEGFRNLRDQGREGDRAWHPFSGPHRRTKRGNSPHRGKTSADESVYARAAYTATRNEVTVGRLVPKLIFSTEPTLPECLPSTPHVSSALEIRQTLLDAIQLVVNLVTNRLDTAAGTPVDPNDPDNTNFQLTIDWLAQLEQFHQNLAGGDSLYCLLRDPPPNDDPLGGGRGLLDQMAETLARQLVAAEEPIPLGGEDNPIELPQAVEDEIAALSENDSIRRADRFANLSAASRATVREEVLAQRIATIKYPFNGNFGEQPWPSSGYDLVHFKLQLEQLELEFSNNETIKQLLITLANSDANRPRIEFEVALERLDATLTMERWPGQWFWVTAAGALVALAIVGSLAVTGLILTLIGLGPLGLIILMMLLSQAPVATVAGGALTLAVVTYLMWDITQLRLTLDQPLMRSSLSPDWASDPEEVVLDPDRVSLEGGITVSFNSQIPSGIHQILDAVVNLAVTKFDAQIRDALESAAVDGLEEAMRSIPHFCLPQPSDARVRVDITGSPINHVDVQAPKHDLIAMTTNGTTERLLSVGALTQMEFPFPGFTPQLTQVDRDLREKLTSRMDQVINDGWIPRLGYAISQNLLNGIVFSQWLAGRFVRDYDDAQIDEAFTTLIDACPYCADISDREVHVWAAASPQVFVTPRAYIEEEVKPYLSVFFPDIRICISGITGKPSTLEIQFSVKSVAHLAFGGIGTGKTRTFFSLERDFLNVLFDDRSTFLQLSPVGTQGLEINGPGFDAIAAMNDAQLLQLLQSLQPLLTTAAERLLRRNNFRQISFVPNSPQFNRQIYDNMVLADIYPRLASVYVVITSFGPISAVLPTRDVNDTQIAPILNLDNLTCEEGEDFRGGS